MNAEIRGRGPASHIRAATTAAIRRRRNRGACRLWNAPLARLRAPMAAMKGFCLASIVRSRNQFQRAIRVSGAPQRICFGLAQTVRTPPPPLCRYTRPRVGCVVMLWLTDGQSRRRRLAGQRARTGRRRGEFDRTAGYRLPVQRPSVQSRRRSSVF